VFKRLFWLTVGAGVGFGGSVYAQRRIRRTIEQYFPDQVARQVSTSMRTFGADVLAAAKEGKAAMRAREGAPLVRLDGSPIGDGRPGPMTRRLQELFDRRARGG